MKTSKLPFRVLAGVIGILCTGGCMGTPRTTDPTKTALEQLLVSTAVDRALEGLDLAKLANKKVFLNTNDIQYVNNMMHAIENFSDKTYAIENFNNKIYAIGLVSVLLGKQGAFMVEDEKDAEIIIVITSGAHSIDRSDSLIGMPAIPIPIPLVGTFEIPEIALFKSIKQTGIAKFSINAYERTTGKQVLAIGPVSGFSYNNFRKVLLFFSFRTTDVPEKKRKWWIQP
jgi:hypothetical protein